METAKKILRLIVCSLILGQSILHAAYAQDTKKTNKGSRSSVIKNLVDKKDFLFVAQSVSPMGAPMRQLTSSYDLQITGDTVVSNLPYFGRAYSAPIDPSQGGIQFTSTKNQFNIKDHRKGGWDILIKPSDAGDVQQLGLSISEGGSATLQVTSTNRQTISFNGYITERKPNI